MVRHLKIASLAFLVFSAGNAEARLMCKYLFYSEADQAAFVKMAELPDSPSSRMPERRFKMYTSGLQRDTDGSIDRTDPVVDTADPSAPFVYKRLDGTEEHIVWLSGNRKLVFKSAMDILRGGIQTVSRVRAFYKNGMEMKGPYHTSSYPWDAEKHQRDDGSFIVHGGAMVSHGPGHLPLVGKENESRTRQYAEVQVVKNEKGEMEEQWIFQDSIFGDKPLKGDKRWVTEKHNHKYGATIFRDEKGNYIRDEKGNYYMSFEEVVEERYGKPWLTSMFVIKLDPTMTKVIGPKISIFENKNPKTGRPYIATERNGGKDGYLAEGPRPVQFEVNGQKVWAIFFSGGDYVTTKYGVHMLVGQPGGGPAGPYKPVVDKDGELIDFAGDLRNMTGGSWGPARPSPFRGADNKYWMFIHETIQADTPAHFIKSGWPKTKDFDHYARRIGLVPIKLKVEKGEIVGIDLDMKMP